MLTCANIPGINIGDINLTVLDSELPDLTINVSDSTNGSGNVNIPYHWTIDVINNGNNENLYQVIFHLAEDSVEKTNEVFNNIRNLLVDLGEGNVDVELLVNGKGVLTMRKSNESNAIRVRHLFAQGVKVAVCENSIKHLKIDRQELIPEIEVVPAGVSELVKKQKEGWAYIRP